jgi:ATP-dependent Lon protease
VTTVEEEEYPQFYHLRPALDPHGEAPAGKEAVVVETRADAPQAEEETADRKAPAPQPPEFSKAKPLPAEGHHVFSENRKGISYETLFSPYIAGASRIVVTDPYIRYFYQIRNMMEFVELVIRHKAPEDQVAIHLVTGPDDGNIAKQRELLDSITTACAGTGVDFTWAYDGTGTAHARDIVTDIGWKIVLDRGLDIFQAPIRTEGFSLGDRMQEHRMVKGFYVTYVKQSG